jgi:hypothetical protein
MCLNLGSKIAQQQALAINPQRGGPFAIVRIGALKVPIYRFASIILSIFRFGSGSQIAPSVVVSNAVNVIDLSGRPFSGHIKPRQAVNPAVFAFDFVPDVAMNAHSSYGASKVISFWAIWLLQRINESALRVISNNFPQPFGGEHAIASTVGRR